MKEGEVSAALKGHLAMRGYTLVSEWSPTDQGVDLVMGSPKKGIQIEAKDSTNSRKNSIRPDHSFFQQNVIL